MAYSRPTGNVRPGSKPPTDPETQRLIDATRQRSRRQIAKAEIADAEIERRQNLVDRPTIPRPKPSPAPEKPIPPPDWETATLQAERVRLIDEVKVKQDRISVINARLKELRRSAANG
jgi:hypothetical protein